MKFTTQHSLQLVRHTIFAVCAAILLFALVVPFGLVTHAQKAVESRREKIQPNPKSQLDSEILNNQEVSLERFENETSTASVNGGSVQTRVDLVKETEVDNDTVATAQRLSFGAAKVTGFIDRVNSATATPPTTRDIDFYQINVAAGDKLFAAVITAASGSTNSLLTVYDADGTTILEEDNDDGSLAATSSSIAGLTFATGGVKYIRIVENAGTGEIRPYDFYYRVVSGTATNADVEPNDVFGGTSTVPANGFFSGAISATTDVRDYYAINLNAGDTIFLSLDANPERDAAFFNPRFGFGSPLFNNFTLIFNDANAGTAANPNSEAIAFTVKAAGTYYVFVDPATAGTGDPTFTYNIAVAVFPAASQRCTTYNSTDIGQAIGPDPAPGSAPNVSSSLLVLDAKRIHSLKVNLNITHALLNDLDVSLTDPQGDQVVLFNDVGAATANLAGQTDMNTTIEDEATFPINTFTIINGYNVQPETFSRMNFFQGQNSEGTWFLNIRDDLVGNAGTLNSWGLTVCEEPLLSTPASLTTTLFNSDFEANDGGFTHNGSLNGTPTATDEWERGMPIAGASTGAITTCNSGMNCWKTDLDGNYDNASTGFLTQNLVSPNFDLNIERGRTLTFSWAQKYQLENATFDDAFVEIREVGGAGAVRRLWTWRDNTMNSGIVGNPNVTIQAAAGWRTFEYDVSEFAGKTVQVVWTLVSDNSVALAGIAVDDVRLTSAKIAPFADFDQNGGTDLSIFRNSAEVAGEGTWYIVNSATGTATIQRFGNDTDRLVPGDYDADGDVDIAVYRPSTSVFYISRGSSQNFQSIVWGSPGDIPVQGDYDGDGATDVAVFRPSQGAWYVRNSSTGTLSTAVFGSSGDQLVPADYDGDGKTDFAVFRNGVWIILESFTGQVRYVQWGLSGDTPVAADYDGDRKVDIAVFRAGVWYAISSRTDAAIIVQFGASGDIPVQGDYDRDRKADQAVFRNGNWFILRSSDGTTAGANWGVAGDRVVPPRYNPLP